MNNYTKTIFLLLLGVFLFIFSTTPNLSAQKKEHIKKIDSLFLELQRTPNTTEKVDELTQLFKKSEKLRYIKYDIIDSAINVAKLLEYPKGLGYAYYIKGRVARHNYDYYKAIKNNNMAVPTLKVAQDTTTLIKCLNSTGIAYRKVNIVDKSFKNYFAAYKLAQKIGKIPSMAIALNGAGNLYIDTKKYKDALVYFKRALKLEQSINNTRGMEYDYTNIGETYMYLEQYDSAHYYAQKGYDIAVKDNVKNNEVYEMALMAKISQKQKNFKKSLQQYKEALAIFKEIKNPRYISNTLINIGRNKIELGQPQEGISSIKEGLKYALQIGSKENVANAYKILSLYYAEKGDYKQAFLNYREATVFRDSILNSEAQKELINMQVAYETHEKEQEIYKLEVTNELTKQLAESRFRKLLVTIIAVVILFIALLLVFILYRKNALLEIENLNGKLQNRLLQIDNEAPKSSTFSEKIAEFELTEREAQILEFIAKGYSNSKIAEELFISTNTVKYHSKNLYTKLDVQNRIEAAKVVNQKPKA